MKPTIFSILLLVISLSVNGQNDPFIQTEQALMDIESLVSNFEKIHYNPYFKTSKTVFNKKKDDLLSSWEKDSISFKKFMVTGMKLSALLSGGHSNMDWQNRKIIPSIKSHHYVPFTGKISIDNKTFIVTKSRHIEISAGMEILSINGISIVDLFKECMTYIGGIKAFKNSTCEMVFPLYLFFNESLKGPYTISCANKKEVKTIGLSLKEFMPLLNNSSFENYTFKILDNEVGLISYNSCTGAKKFNKFLKKTFKELEAKKITKLIIDIRENSGGNSDLNDLLLAYITTKSYLQSSGRFWKVSQMSKKVYALRKYEKFFGQDFMTKYYNTPNQDIIEEFWNDDSIQPISPNNYFEGNTCFLIGPNTFSSANFLADAVKTYKLSTLIGSATGEYTNDFGEQLSFSLPYSGCIVNVSSTYDIGANGDKTIFEPVYPDIKVEDNTLDYAVDWIKKEASKK